MPNWKEVLTEISTGSDTVRRKYLKKLNQHTKRNVIAYYSGWLSKPGILQSGIDDEDKNGFMMAVHKLNRNNGLDLILHTPGGNIASTQSIVHYLHQMFGHDIRAIIPQIAMSAGTMIACSCKKIIMGKQSNLGPIDPQLMGVAAEGVKQEFERAFKEIKADPDKVHVWRPILEQYQPTFLSDCENAVDWSNDFVQKQLETVMFDGRPDPDKQAKKVVRTLSNYSQNKQHNKHIHIEECINMELDVEALEDDDKLQDLVLTVHHCYMHTLMNTPAYKITENHLGAALVKNEAPRVLKA